MSFLEMLDVLNEDLIAKGEEPIAFDHDCREGICGMCGFMINGVAHGPLPRHHASASFTCATSRTATSSTWSRGAPRAFPVIKDLVVDRSAFDRIIAAGGYISVATGSAPDGNAIPVPKENADRVHGRGGLHRLRRLRGACARTPRRRCSPAPRSRISACCRRASRSATSAPSRMVAQANARSFRQLHQHRRVRSGLSEGDQAGSDRAHESRLPARAVGRARRGRGDSRGLTGWQSAL